MSPVTGKSTGGGVNISASHSGGDDMGSTSTGSMEAATAAGADISGENEKLKKDNEKLSDELARTKKHCDDLVAFLRDSLNVGPDVIDCIIRQGTCGSSNDDAVRFDATENLNNHNHDDDENAVGECEPEQPKGDNGESLKLFGVWLKGQNGKENSIGKCRKRGRQDYPIAATAKELKTLV